MSDILKPDYERKFHQLSSSVVGCRPGSVDRASVATRMGRDPNLFFGSRPKIFDPVEGHDPVVAFFLIFEFFIIE